MKISLKAARVNAGYTQTDLAKKINRNPVTIYNWESGKTKMSMQDFKSLCEVLQVNEDDIFLPHESSLN